MGKLNVSLFSREKPIIVSKGRRSGYAWVKTDLAGLNEFKNFDSLSSGFEDSASFRAFRILTCLNISTVFIILGTLKTDFS